MGRFKGDLSSGGIGSRMGAVGIKEAISRVLGFEDNDGTRLPLYGSSFGGESE